LKKLSRKGDEGKTSTPKQKKKDVRVKPPWQVCQKKTTRKHGKVSRLGSLEGEGEKALTETSFEGAGSRPSRASETARENITEELKGVIETAKVGGEGMRTKQGSLKWRRTFLEALHHSPRKAGEKEALKGRKGKSEKQIKNIKKTLRWAGGGEKRRTNVSTEALADETDLKGARRVLTKRSRRKRSPRGRKKRKARYLIKDIHERDTTKGKKRKEFLSI